MLRDGLIEDIPVQILDRYNHKKIDDRNILHTVHPKVEEYVNHLNTFEDGLGIIRESNTTRASELRALLKRAISDKSAKWY